MLVGASSGDDGASFAGEIISLIKRHTRGEARRLTLPGQRSWPMPNLWRQAARMRSCDVSLFIGI